MKTLLSTLSAALVAAGLASTAAAQDKPRIPVTAANTEQKAKFVNNLVTNSAALRSIEQSGDPEAIATVKTARELLDKANADITAGNFEAANDKLNEIVNQVRTVTQKVSEHSVKGARAKEMLENRKATVKALVDAYERVAREKGAGSVTEKKAVVQKYISEADMLSARGDDEGALRLMDQAYAAVSGDVATLRDGDKLVKELKFASAEDEYTYEVDRNDSHFFLLKLTLSEKSPDPSILAQIETQKQQAQQLRTEAEGLAKSKDHVQAVKLLGQSTEVLIRALRMGGAYIPG